MHTYIYAQAQRLDEKVKIVRDINGLVAKRDEMLRTLCEDVDQNSKGKTDSKQRQVWVRVCMYVCMRVVICLRIMCEDIKSEFKRENTLSAEICACMCMCMYVCMNAFDVSCVKMSIKIQKGKHTLSRDMCVYVYVYVCMYERV